MPEVGERLDKVEERLGGVEERLGGVEGRLGGVETGLKDVREAVGGLHGEVGGLHGEVGGVRGEVSRLRALGEMNADDIRKVAEVQAHHGKKLDEIARALEPLGEIHDFIRRVAPNHELRIQELEKRTGMRE